MKRIVDAATDVPRVKFERILRRRRLSVVGRSFTGWLVLAAFVLDDVGLSFCHDVLRNGRQRSVSEAGFRRKWCPPAASPNYSVSTIHRRAGPSKRQTASCDDQPCCGSNLPSGSEGRRGSAINCNRIRDGSGPAHTTWVMPAKPISARLASIADATPQRSPLARGPASANIAPGAKRRTPAPRRGVLRCQPW